MQQNLNIKEKKNNNNNNDNNNQFLHIANTDKGWSTFSSTLWNMDGGSEKFGYILSY